MFRSIPLGVGLVVTAVGACGGDDGPEPVPTHDFAHVAAPLRCWSSVHAYGLFALDDGAIAVGYTPNQQSTSSVSMANLTLVSRDEGRTFERPVASMERAQIGTLRGPLAASRGVFPLGGGAFFSLAGIVGTSRLPGPTETFSDLDWLLYVAPSGEARDLLATTDAVTLPSGETSERVWRPERDLAIASAGMWFWAQRGAGAWEVVGWKSVTLDFAPGIPQAITLAARKDLAVVSSALDRRFYLVRPGAPPQALFVSDAQGAATRAETVALVGDRLAFITRDDHDAQLVLASLDGSERQSWPWPSDLYASMLYEVAPDGTLWIASRQPATYDDPKVAIVRLRPGAAAPERLDLDLEAAPWDGVAAMLARPDGRLLASFRTRPERELRGTRYAGSTMFCELGPGVTQGIEPITVEPIRTALARPGEAVRIARVGDGTTVSDRFYRTGSGTIYATQLDEVRAWPPDVDALVFDAGPTTGGSDAFAFDTILEASDATVTATIWIASSLLDPPATRKVTWTFGPQGAIAQATAYPWGNDQVFDAQRSLGRTFATLARGFTAEPDLATVDPEALPLGRAGTILGPRGHAVGFESGYAYTSGTRTQARPVRFVRFDAWRGRYPDLGPCDSFVDAPAPCEPLADTDIVAARLDEDGNLYAVDFRHGRVVYVAAGAPGTSMQTLADGLVSPSDLRLATVDGARVLMVYDNDVFAFRVDPARTVHVRRTGTIGASADLVADAGPRDHRGCLFDGPCLAERVIAGPAPRCVAGERFGAQGRVELEGQPLTITSWSDTEVCFAAAGAERDGQLVVVGANGARSAPAAWHGPRAITGWSVPPTVTASTPIVATGTNLRAGEGLAFMNGTLAYADDTRLELLVSYSGPVVVSDGATVLGQRSVTLTPEVVSGCTSAAGETCEVLASGLDVAIGAVTIGGLPATVTRWAPPSIRLSWPAGLSPGTHAIAIASGGATATGEVELEADATHVLVATASIAEALTLAEPRPVTTSLGVLSGARAYSMFVPLPQIVGFAGGATLAPGTSPFTRAPHLVEAPGGVYAVGVTASGPRVSRVTASAGALSLAELGAVTTPDLGQPTGAGIIDGEIVVAWASPVTLQTTLTTLDVAAASGGVVPARVITTTPGIFGFVDSTHTSASAWVVPGGVYVGECRNLAKPSELYFVPVARGGGGDLVASGREIVQSGNPAARALACSTTADGGFLWVQREDNGDERLLRWSPSTPGVRTQVVVLPTTLPGVGQTAGPLPGVLDVIEGSGGDAVFLLADRESAVRGLRVVRWQAADGTWHASAPFGTATAAEPGEVCVGPVAPASCPDGVGTSGCAPHACPYRPAQRFSRPATLPQEGYLVPHASGVHVVYEVFNTQRAPGFVFGGIEVHARTLAVP